MAGLGGAALALGAVRYFHAGMTAGRGFIVLGAIIFGKGNPGAGRFLRVSLLWRGRTLCAIAAQTFQVRDPRQFLLMLPYLPHHCRHGGVHRADASTGAVWGSRVTTARDHRRSGGAPVARRET